MATSTLDVVIRGKDLLSGTLSKVNSELGGLKSRSDGLKDSILAGVGLGAGIGAFGLLTSAIQKGADVLRDSVAAAMEDEASVKKLSVALGDAIPGWNGHTGAIERTIAARQKLGFEDDVLRNSLSTLASVTHDTTRALDLQGLAMNIARFRGIDLASATDAVAKAAAGNMKSLYAMIPATKGAANAQEALRIAAQTTAGQVEAYANTTAGKMEAAQVAMTEASEKLGYALTPVLSAAADTAAGYITTLSDVIGTLGRVSIPGTKESVDILGGAINALSFGTLGAIQNAQAYAQAQRDGAEAAGTLADQQDYDRVMVGFASRATQDAVPVMDSYRGILHEAGDAARVAAGSIGAVGDAIIYTYRAAENFNVNSATGFRITDQQAADSADAWQRYLEARDKATAATTAGTSATKADTVAIREQTAAEKAHADALQATIDKLAKMRAATDAYHRLPDKGSAMWDMATGAPVPGGVEYVNGKPLFRIPKTASGGGQTAHTWSPNGATGGSAGMGGYSAAAMYDNGAGVPIVINLDGRVIADVVDTYLRRRV